MRLTAIGLDIAKKVFQVHGVDAQGHVPRLAREVLPTLAARPRECAAQIAALDRRPVTLSRRHPICRTLAALLAPSADVVPARSAAPGIGPGIAAAVIATLPGGGRA
jgi:transposase